MEKTLGEKRVRTDFNVTANDTVTMIKSDAAQIINMLEDLKHNTQSDWLLSRKPNMKKPQCGQLKPLLRKWNS